MPTVYRLLPEKQTFFDDDGNLLNGGKLYVFEAGSSTPKTSYTDSTGATPNSHPIVLNARGETPNGVYVSAGTSKIRLDDSLDVTLWTRDLVPAVNDSTAAFSEWLSSGLTPTFLSATTFSVPGDHTDEFHSGRRLKLTDATTLYGTVFSSSYSSVTTVTVVLDGVGAALSASLTAVSLGITSASNTSAPSQIDDVDRNIIINGGMIVAQRGTSFAAVSDGAYTLDRWIYNKVGAMVHTITQDTDVPAVSLTGVLYTASLRLQLTTPDTSIASGDYCTISQRVEGYNARIVAQRSFVVSFCVKADKTGTYCVSCRNAGSDRTFIGTFAINAAATWEYKTVVVSASPSSGTWDYTNGIGMTVCITLAAGSTYQDTAGSWRTGSFLASSAQVNGVDTGATNFRITAFRVEPGIRANVYEHINIESELARCRRYYRSKSLEIWGGNTTSGASYYHNIPLDPPMRTAPSMSATDGGNSGFAAGTPTFTPSAASVAAVKASNATVSGGYYQFSWTAAAEL